MLIVFKLTCPDLRALQHHSLKGLPLKWVPFINYNLRGTKTCEYVLPHEHYHLSSRDGGKRFGPDPYGEVIDGD